MKTLAFGDISFEVEPEEEQMVTEQVYEIIKDLKRGRKWDQMDAKEAQKASNLSERDAPSNINPKKVVRAKNGGDKTD